MGFVEWMIVILGALLLVLCTVGIIYAVKNRDKIRANAQREAEALFTEPEAFTARAEVIDQRCAVRSEGTRIARTVTEFCVYFRTEAGEEIALLVPEAYYHSIEIGQTGLVTIVNGELYSFDIDGVTEDIT